MGERRGTCKVLVRNMREGDQLKEPGVDGRIILKWNFEKWSGRMDWIDLAHHRDRWRLL
jgi:hypothetical protein